MALYGLSVIINISGYSKIFGDSTEAIQDDGSFYYLMDCRCKTIKFYFHCLHACLGHYRSSGDLLFKYRILHDCSGFIEFIKRVKER